MPTYHSTISQQSEPRTHMHPCTHHPHSPPHNKVTILINMEPPSQLYTPKPISSSQPITCGASPCESRCDRVGQGTQRRTTTGHLSSLLPELPPSPEHVHQCHPLAFQTPTTINHTTCHWKCTKPSFACETSPCFPTTDCTHVSTLQTQRPPHQCHTLTTQTRLRI